MSDQTADQLSTCQREGHDYRYIRGSTYRWDCTRCRWAEHRTKPSPPLEPSMPWPRWQIIDTWPTLTADTDIRCPHHTPAGQCLDHQGHAGEHQYPQETR